MKEVKETGKTTPSPSHRLPMTVHGKAQESGWYLWEEYDMVWIIYLPSIHQINCHSPETAPNQFSVIDGCHAMPRILKSSQQ